MPRGFPPGERRGGRQLGTPNKKTRLKLAAMNAAGGDASPLEFLLRLMRDPNFPVADRLNAAAEAAQYVHTRPRLVTLERDAVVRIIEDGPQGFGRGAVAQFMKLFCRQIADADAGATGINEAVSELTPLAFMLQVMRDPEVAPQMRFKAVKLAARYSHARRPAAFDDPVGNEGPAILDNRWGFKISPELAIKFSRPSEDVDEFNCEKKKLTDSLADWRAHPAGLEPKRKSFGPAADVELPNGYGYEEFKVAENLLKKIEAKRKTQSLVPAEDFAEAYLRVRKAIYQREREKAQLRIEELEEKLSAHPDPALQREKVDLSRRFPDPLDDQPVGNSIKAWRAASRTRPASEAK